MRILLVAGSWEARQIASGLTRVPGLSVIASVPRAEPRPVALGVATRIGSFEAVGNLETWMTAERISAVIDAGHPFDVDESANIEKAARALQIDYVRFLRPGWLPEEGDDWTFANDPADVVRHVPDGNTVFIATGWQDLSAFSDLAGRTVYARVTGRAARSFPFKMGRYIHGIPPFSIESEIAVFERLGVGWLVARNSGSLRNKSKLEAARFLGIKVAMIRRPPQPPGLKVDTVAEVLSWVRRRM